MGMMGMFKWLRKDVQRERNGWNLTPKQYGLNNSNESYRNALQAFIDRRRCTEDGNVETDSAASLEKNRDYFSKNNNNNKLANEWRQDSKSIVPGIPHLKASEIFEIGWVPGTDDRYLELIFAEWQNTRVSLKRHTYPDCKEAVKADLEVLSEIRHPNVLLLMATTQTDDHGLVSIFESVECTLYNYIHEQGERISIQGIAKCGTKLCDALRYSHMRGYVHGAISPHCVYLTSNGIVKLGGWELAVHLDNPRPEREYEERLRAEIFRWQAPELFYGREPRKESDVYGLSLLIWEMCTTHVPWTGHNRADVETQYVHWKRSVIIDLYQFPPELRVLLEGGLQLDIIKRTQDMNRMRRLLQRLEMQYEDKEPVYVDPFPNNNNETMNSYKKSSNGKNTRLSKSTSAKQLTYTVKNSESTTRQYECPRKCLSGQNIRSKISVHTEQVNLLDFNEQQRNPKNNIRKNTNVLYHKEYKKINPVSIELEESDVQNEDDNSKTHLWRNTYKKQGEGKNLSIYSNLAESIEDEDESCRDARANLKQLKKFLASKREEFFFGNDSSSASDTSDKAKKKILTQARSKDYEPHKPASHKTSLEPKYNKSPGQYDATYLKTSNQQYRKTYPQLGDCIKNAIAQSPASQSEDQSFFESSLWRREKMICMSKMSKSSEQDDSTFSSEKHTNNSTTTAATSIQTQFTETESLKNDGTYIIDDQTKTDIETSREKTFTEDTNDSNETLSQDSKPMQVLKDALDRATRIVRSDTPNTDESSPPSPFKTYENFDVQTDQEQTCRSVFEDIYNLRSNDTEEIRSIEKSENVNETFLLSTNSIPSNTNKSETSYESNCQFGTYTKSFAFDSIAEISGESNTLNTTSIFNSNTADSRKSMETGISNDLNPETNDDLIEKTPVKNFALRLLNDNVKFKNCNSCNQSALPRRRSLPAALSQLRTLNNSMLGKLPIRRGDMPDNTVEDLYIDDEFGDSLNVNMILLQEGLLLDEDFLPDM